jgi:tetratricopeptide (TPR) repeat protein
VELPIPIEVVEALTKGDIGEATRIFRTESPSSRSLYLLAEMKRILNHEKDKKPPKFERHEYYQNLGIAYHNLFLFLKRNGTNNEEFYKKALKFYKKAGKSKAFSERYEAKLLTAALKAANGETDEADKLFGELDTSIITDTYRGYSYLATFYSAIGNQEMAIEALEKAYAMNPGKVKLWVAICDDFASIRHEPGFIKMTDGWK